MREREKGMENSTLFPLLAKMDLHFILEGAKSNVLDDFRFPTAPSMNREHLGIS